MPQQKQFIKGVPGFINVNGAGHGYSARHAYNPMSGEALSMGQVRDIRNGKITLTQALNRNQQPIGTGTVRRQKSQWKITAFRRMSGAYNYATTQTANPSYFVVRGHVIAPYENERTLSFRAISTLMSPGRIKRDLTLEDCWQRVSNEISIDAATTYYVWEKI